MSSNTRVGIEFEQPKTFDERIEVASSCCASLEFTMPLVVDTMKNRVEKAYSAFPDRLYIIDQEGRVAYKGGRGPFGYMPRELEQTLVMLLIAEPPALATAADEPVDQGSDAEDAETPAEPASESDEVADDTAAPAAE